MFPGFDEKTRRAARESPVAADDEFLKSAGGVPRLRRHLVTGWLSASLRGYPETENLKTMVHLRDDGIRPYIELEPTDHPLALEQRAGIDAARVGEILSLYLHDPPAGEGRPPA